MLRTYLPGAGMRLAFGEPGAGRGGWRLTHRQSKAALSISPCSEAPVVRYGDALLAGIVGDELLGTSMRWLYLEPLEAERDGGAMLRGTLHAYCAAQGNLSSSAVALGVSRKTVHSRLRTVEQTPRRAAQ